MSRNPAHTRLVSFPFARERIRSGGVRSLGGHQRRRATLSGMSTTNLTIALAIAALLNQWAIAIFNKRATQSIHEAKTVDSVATKAKKSPYRFVALVVDLILLVFGICLMSKIVSIGRLSDAPPTLQITIQIAMVVSFLAIIIVYQAHKVVSGALGLLFPP